MECWSELYTNITPLLHNSNTPFAYAEKKQNHRIGEKPMEDEALYAYEPANGFYCRPEDN